MDPDSGVLRAVYLRLMTGLRGVLGGTRLLRAWDRAARRRPRGPLAHLRTLLAVHNADDLVAMDLPWWTYESADLVQQHLTALGGRARVFEFGSGASTVWLARRAASVDSVEHVPAWAERVRALLATTPGLLCRPAVHVVEPVPSASPETPSGSPSAQGLDFTAYVRTIHEVRGPFDLVLVDGRAREAAVRAALDVVAPNGVVLLDDAQRSRYRDVVESAAEQGWTVVRTRGATPCQPLPRETVLLRGAPHPDPAAGTQRPGRASTPR